MNVTAALVKKLRERTGAGMMDCKRALAESGGDIDAAIERMRVSGLIGHARKAGRVAAQGLVAMARGDSSAVLVEVNCETDFVARGDDFRAFADEVARIAMSSGATDSAGILQQTCDSGESVEDRRRGLISRIGENIELRRVERRSAGPGQILGGYVHGGRIGALAVLAGGDASLAHELAMHISASRPLYLDVEAVPAGVVEEERRLLLAEAARSGKPEAVVANMVEGRLKKHLASITLAGQPFIREPKKTVAGLLREAGAAAVEFVRLEVGEGVEVAEDDFVAEVQRQAGL